MSRPRPFASLVIALFVAGVAAALAPPRAIEASPGEPTPTPQPKDDFSTAMDKAKAIPSNDKGALLIVRTADPRIAAVRSAANAIAKEGEAKGVGRIVTHLDDKLENLFADHAVHFILREALREVPTGSPGEAELEKRLKTEKQWTRQVALAWVFRRRPATATIDATLSSLARNTMLKPFVQSAAIRAMGFRHTTSAVDELIDLMQGHEVEKDRIWIDARMALHEITGYDRPNAKAWHALRQQVGKFDSAPHGGELPWRFSIPNDPKSADHPVVGEKVVICIDTSGSLHVRDPKEGDPVPKEQKLCPECKHYHQGDPDGPIDRQRLEREKIAVGKILAGLRPKSKFQLVRFDTSARSLNVRGLMLEVSLHNLQSAKDFLAPVEATGITKMVRGIDEAFACEDMDVMYLLTDGAPTADDMPNTVETALCDEVVGQARVLDRYKGVRIYSIGFIQQQAPLLETLSNEHGGNTVYLD